MKNYTIKERQEMYEHLLTLQLPDLLAALIAKRLDKDFIENDFLNAFDKHSAESIVFDGFDWFDTEEGMDFWQGVHDDIESVMYGYEPDYLGFDTELNESKPPSNIEIIPPTISLPETLARKVFGYVEEQEPKVSFWNKVKLFLGRLFYKV